MKRVRCEDSGVLVPKDKAVKRFQVRNIVDASAIRDLQESSTIDGEAQLMYVIETGLLISNAAQQAARPKNAGILRYLVCGVMSWRLRVTVNRAAETFPATWASGASHATSRDQLVGRLWAEAKTSLYLSCPISHWQ